MDNPEGLFGQWFTISLKWLIAIISSFWVNVDLDIRILIVLSVVDVITTLFNPNRAITKVTRRLAMTFILVGTVHFIYAVARTQVGLNIGFDIAAFVCMFYNLGEAIIITRNLSSAGLQLPPKWLDFLSHAEGITGVDRQAIVAIKVKQDEDKVNLELKLKPITEETKDD